MTSFHVEGLKNILTSLTTTIATLFMQMGILASDLAAVRSELDSRRQPPDPNNNTTSTLKNATTKNTNNTNNNSNNNNNKQRNRPPKINNNSRPGKKACYATAASEAPDLTFQEVRRTKKKVEPLFHHNTTRIQRDIVTTMVNEIRADPKDPAASNKIFNTINQFLNGQLRFMIAKITNQRTIILKTPSNESVETGLRFNTEIAAALTSLEAISADIKANTRMTKFIIHVIPTSIGTNPIVAGNAVPTQIRANHPLLPLAQIPGWRCRPNALQEKAHASVIITFTGSYKLQNISFKWIVLINK